MHIFYLYAVIAKILDSNFQKSILASLSKEVIALEFKGLKLGFK